MRMFDRSTFIRTVLLLLGLTVCFFHSYAEERVCIQVNDPQGLPVPNAGVVIEPQAAAAVIHGSSGSTGRYCKRISTGGYVIRVTHDRLSGRADTIWVGGQGGSMEKTYLLGLAATSSQVQVTASRLPENLLEAPNPVLHVDRSQMEKIGARQLADALQEQPEIVTYAGGQHSGGGSTNLQGFSSRDVELLIDGQPLTGRTSGYVDLNQVDASIVEAIEVKTGASSMTYGLQGMGGAINMITRRASTGADWSAEGGYGSFNTGVMRTGGGFSKDGWAAHVAASQQRSLGYELDPSTIAKTQSANHVRNLFGSVYLPQVGRLSSGLTMLWLDQRFWGFDGSDVTGVYDFARPKKRLVILPRAAITTSNESLLTLRARHLGYRSDEDVVYRTAFDVRAQTTHNEARGADAEWMIAKPSGVRGVVGVFYNRQEMIGDRLTTPGGMASRDSWSHVANLEVPIVNRVKLQGGYRLDSDSLFGSKVSPQAALAWRVADGFSVSASVARGFRAPDFNELYILQTHAGGRVRIYGNPETLPQRSWSGSAGFMSSFGGGTRLEGRLFHHTLEDLILTRHIGREGPTNVYRYSNVGDARIRGGSVSLHKLVTRQIELTGSYQYLYSRDRTQGTDLEYAPRHRGSIRATYSSGAHGLLVSLFGNATGRTFFSLTNGAPNYMSAFELFGLNVQKDLNRRVAARLTFRNLTGDVSPAYRLTAPFSVEIALKIRLSTAE